eukprot:scaffold29950_cov60-Phaeocystis_antarctica.AAC.4
MLSIEFLLPLGRGGGRGPGWQRGGLRVCRGGGSSLARVRAICSVVGFAWPCLQAAADGAAVVAVVERAAAALHIVHQALLLGLQLLVALLQLPPLLCQSSLILHLLLIICIDLSQVHLYHVRDDEAHHVRADITKCQSERKLEADGGQKEVQGQQEAHQPELVRKAHSVRPVDQSGHESDEGPKVIDLRRRASGSRVHHVHAHATDPGNHNESCPTL